VLVSPTQPLRVPNAVTPQANMPRQSEFVFFSSFLGFCISCVLFRLDRRHSLPIGE
jgi:hypothetical protein